jgi:hypothetical protein
VPPQPRDNITQACLLSIPCHTVLRLTTCSVRTNLLVCIWHLLLPPYPVLERCLLLALTANIAQLGRGLLICWHIAVSCGISGDDAYSV